MYAPEIVLIPVESIELAYGTHRFLGVVIRTHE
jgi:hypothetical protein